MIKVGDRLPEATLNELTVEYTQGCPTGPEAYKISDLTRGKRIVIFGLPGAFTRTDLETRLRDQGVEQLVVAGFMTQMCCDTTAREAAHRGFRVLMAGDAMAAMSVQAPDGTVIPHDQVHRVHLASLHGFLATSTTVAALTEGAGL